jgi:hypothetical protein
MSKSYKSRFKTTKKAPQSLKRGRRGVGVWEISESNNYRVRNRESESVATLVSRLFRL